MDQGRLHHLYDYSKVSLVSYVVKSNSNKFRVGTKE